MRSISSQSHWLGLFALVASCSGTAGTVYDREDFELGTFLSVNRNGETAILTSKGFIALVSGGNGSLQGPQEGGETAYLDSTCAGEAYVLNVPIRPYVFRKGAEILMVGNEVPTVLAPGSSYFIWAQVSPNPFPTCHEISVTPEIGIIFVDPKRLNDPAITGIGNGPFDPPLRVTSWSGFNTGFEPKA